MRWLVIVRSLVLLALVPGGGLLQVAWAQDETPHQDWEAAPGDYPDDPYADEEPGQYDPDGLAPEDLPVDDPAFDDAPPDWEDEVPLKEE
jgi:hypothetical protein